MGLLLGKEISRKDWVIEGSDEIEDEVSAGSADEMSVNMIAEKKRKLLSRVLGPSKKSRVEEEEEQEEVEEEDNRLVVDTGREKEKRRKEKKRRKKEKKLRA